LRNQERIKLFRAIERERLKAEQESLKTCKGCGLENPDYNGKAANPHLLPCKVCKRNLFAQASIADFFCERWSLDWDNAPIIDIENEFLTPHERALLRLIRDVTLVYG
jgi:hypothetical protein